MTNNTTLRSVFMSVVFVLIVSVAYLTYIGTAIGQSQTYLYVDNSGVVREITADSATDAMTNATNRYPNSGVMLADQASERQLVGKVVALDTVGGEVFGTGGSVDNLYLYVDINGNVKSVVADTPEQAIAIAPNIDPHSGVARADDFR